MGVDTAMIDIQRKVMRESLLEDVRTEIEMAREGQIPPSWQHDRLEDLETGCCQALDHRAGIQVTCAPNLRRLSAVPGRSPTRNTTRQIVADSRPGQHAFLLERQRQLHRLNRPGRGRICGDRLSGRAGIGRNAPSLRRAVYPRSAGLRSSARLHPRPESPNGSAAPGALTNHITTREEAFGCALVMLQSYIPK